MPKFWGAALLTLVVVAGLAGCAAPASPDDDRPLVLTTFTVIADMVREVGGDEVRVESITKPGAEIHGYEPTPSDLVAVSSADLVINNGLGLERWFESFMSGTDAPRVELGAGIRPIDIAEGEYKGRPNPHAWMSPVAAETYVAAIQVALSDLVPARADVFASNAAAYTEQLRTITDTLFEAVDAVPENRRVLVSCEGAFSYLARDVGLDEVYLWPVNSDSQGTPQQIRAAIDVVRDRDVPTVFCESTVNDGAMQQVARESGADYGGALYVDSLSEPGGVVPSYLELLQYDVDLIVEGLSR